MSGSGITEQPKQHKPFSLAAQIEAVRMIRAADFRRAFPAMRASECDRIKQLLDAAIYTLSQLTDW